MATKAKPAKPKPTRARAPKGGMTFKGKFYRGGCFIPAEAVQYLKAPRRPAKAPQISDDVLVMVALSELPVSAEYAQAMHRYLRGRSTQRDKTVLDGRKLLAIQSLRDGAPTDHEWKKWNGLYIQTAKGMA